MEKGRKALNASRVDTRHAVDGSKHERRCKEFTTWPFGFLTKFSDSPRAQRRRNCKPTDILFARCQSVELLLCNLQLPLHVIEIFIHSIVLMAMTELYQVFLVLFLLCLKLCNLKAQCLCNVCLVRWTRKGSDPSTDLPEPDSRDIKTPCRSYAT